MNIATQSSFPIDGTAQDQAHYIRRNGGSEELADLYAQSTDDELGVRRQRALEIRDIMADLKVHYDTVICGKSN